MMRLPFQFGSTDVCETPKPMRCPRYRLHWMPKSNMRQNCFQPFRIGFEMTPPAARKTSNAKAFFAEGIQGASAEEWERFLSAHPDIYGTNSDKTGLRIDSGQVYFTSLDGRRFWEPCSDGPPLTG